MVWFFFFQLSAAFQKHPSNKQESISGLDLQGLENQYSPTILRSLGSQYKTHPLSHYCYVFCVLFSTSQSHTTHSLRLDDMFKGNFHRLNL